LKTNVQLSINDQQQFRPYLDDDDDDDDEG